MLKILAWKMKEKKKNEGCKIYLKRISGLFAHHCNCDSFLLDFMALFYQEVIFF